MRIDPRLPLLLGGLLLLDCSSLGKEHPVNPQAAPPADAPPAVRQAFDQGAPVAPALVAGHDGMGLTLFQQLRQASPAANLSVSPLSVAQCLGMIYNGSGGATRTAMAKAMALADPDPALLNPQNAALLASLYGADAGVTLQIANGIWARADILPGFLATDLQYYGAPSASLDGAPATINAWVAQKTQGRIPALLDPNLDCSRLDAILVDAIYFKGTWATPFPAANTQARPFTRADGSVVNPPMMAQTASAGYRATAQAEVARMPYGGGRYGMLFVLPRPGVSMAALVAGLDPSSWNTLTQGLPLTSLSLTLPKFKTSWNGSLKPALTQMGMGVAFDPFHAEFPAMATKAQYLDFVIHQATVEVDETGTVATAATAGGMAPTAVPQPVTLTLDRPFLYAIQDSGTGEILFLGQMMDPTGS